MVPGEAELLALVLVYAIVGPMVIFPWGVRGQLGAVCIALVCYIVALNTTARPSTDVGLGLFGVVIIGGFTLGTAGFLERYRLGFFRQTEALRRANAALEDASRTKTEFLADVSHELRTPLNVMIGYLQMLEEGAFGALPPGSNEPLLRMRHSTEMLLGLVNDFLDLSRLESRKMKLRTENVDLTPLLNEVAGLVRPLLRGKPIDLVVTQGDGLVVSADRSRVRQVVVNLLTNAAKFTSNGRIELRARPVEPGRIAIEVADTGPGIPQDERDTIFEPYHRSARTSHLGGVGIGLALSRQLTEAMGGSITVDSEPGGGARFSVRLPSVSTVAPAHG